MLVVVGNFNVSNTLELTPLQAKASPRDEFVKAVKSGKTLFKRLSYLKLAYDVYDTCVNNRDWCERNPRIVIKSSGEVFANYPYPCNEGYQDRAVNYYASKNNFNYKFYDATTRNYVFEKR